MRMIIFSKEKTELLINKYYYGLYILAGIEEALIAMLVGTIFNPFLPYNKKILWTVANRIEYIRSDKDLYELIERDNIYDLPTRFATFIITTPIIIILRRYISGSLLVLFLFSCLMMFVLNHYLESFINEMVYKDKKYMVYFSEFSKQSIGWHKEWAFFAFLFTISLWIIWFCAMWGAWLITE